jgi:hypothetical protein
LVLIATNSIFYLEIPYAVSYLQGAIVEREKGAEKVTVAATATASAEQKG